MKKKNKELASINCEEAVVRFNDFIDNYLIGRAREELLNHLSECKHCMERFEFEQLLKSKVHQLLDGEEHSMRKKMEQLIASI